MMVYIIDGSIGSFNPHLIPTYKPSIATVTGHINSDPHMAPPLQWLHLRISMDFLDEIWKGER